MLSTILNCWCCTQVFQKDFVCLAPWWRVEEIPNAWSPFHILFFPPHPGQALASLKSRVKEKRDCALSFAFQFVSTSKHQGSSIQNTTKHLNKERISGCLIVDCTDTLHILTKKSRLRPRAVIIIGCYCLCVQVHLRAAAGCKWCECWWVTPLIDIKVC